MKKIVYLITLTFFAFMVVSFSVAEEAQVLVFKIHDREPGNSAALIPIPPVYDPYDPSGKPDPFLPIFSDGSDKTAPTTLKYDCIANPVLEKLSLSQLELSGIVLTEHQPVALFQEANGKGHMITEDMCIGIHGGKVAEIRNDRIIIQTKIQDVSGDVKVKKTEMKLKRRAN